MGEARRDRGQIDLLLISLRSVSKWGKKANLPG